MNNNNKRRPVFLGYLIPILIIIILMSMFNRPSNQGAEMTHNELIEMLENKEVASLVYEGEVLRGVKKDKEKTPFEVVIPEGYFNDFYDQYIEDQVKDGDLKITFEKKEEPSTFLLILPDLIFLIIMFVLFYSLFKKTSAASNSMNAFSKSKARLNKDNRKPITFDDVAGLKEEKEELSEVVDFLMNPGKFTEIGARVPKGILMVGPPGTGKTYLSRAVAGEAGVPFYSISGSDFVEMFVGVGASRVRDLFEEGKKHSPCIIFIDEIDAVGRRRGAGLGGGNDEREQTLNQLLVEMDGFDENQGIIVMAATNRPDILDPALLRPGRFDRRVMIGMPDVKEREEIIKVHIRNKYVADDVDINALARQTAGFTPADIENMTNEAALLTARKNEKEIDMATFEEASIKVVAGPEKKSRKVTEHDRKLTAYHEGGHAIVTRAMPEVSNEVNMITIVPRGQAGGFTSFLPEDDQTFLSYKEMKASLVTFLGGRAAESIVMDDISTGASNDIERATKLCRAMIAQYGMSPTLGPVSYEESKGNIFLGEELGQVRSYSEATAQEIDREVRGMMTWAMNTAKDIIKVNMPLMDKLAEELLEKETVRRQEFEDLFQEYGYEYDMEAGKPVEKKEAQPALEGAGEDGEDKDEGSREGENL